MRDIGPVSYAPREATSTTSVSTGGNRPFGQQEAPEDHSRGQARGVDPVGMARIAVGHDDREAAVRLVFDLVAVQRDAAVAVGRGLEPVVPEHDVREAAAREAPAHHQRLVRPELVACL